MYIRYYIYNYIIYIIYIILYIILYIYIYIYIAKQKNLAIVGGCLITGALTRTYPWVILQITKQLLGQNLGIALGYPLK